MTSTTRPRSRSRALRIDAPDLDAAIAAAERDAVVIWRGERDSVRRPAGPDRPHRRPRRARRPLRRLDRGARGDQPAVRGAARPLARGGDGHRAIDDLARWRSPRVATSRRWRSTSSGWPSHSETVYYAALRRYLALIDIEQGDATIADLWHVTRGAAWSHWFGERELDRAAGEAGRAVADGRARRWVALRGDPAWPARTAGRIDAGGRGRRGVRHRWSATRPGCARRSRMAPDEIASFADFVAFVRLWRLRRALAADRSTSCACIGSRRPGPPAGVLQRHRRPHDRRRRAGGGVPARRRRAVLIGRGPRAHMLAGAIGSAPSSIGSAASGGPTSERRDLLRRAGRGADHRGRACATRV